MFGCCGLAVLWGLIVAVTIGPDVIGSCGLVAGKSGLVVTGTSAIVVCGGSVIVDGFVGGGPAVVMVFVVNVIVDCCCGFDEVVDGGCVVELLAGGSPGPVVTIESIVSGAGVVGSVRSVTTNKLVSAVSSYIFTK